MSETEGWRTVLEPTMWSTCRVGNIMVRDAEGRSEARLSLEPADADPAARCLPLMIGWGGGGRYDHTEVVETEDAVHVLVFIAHAVPTNPRPGVLYVRTCELQRAVIAVNLAAPVGARRVVGSVGGPLKYGMTLRADCPPRDSVASIPRQDASAQASHLIAQFEQQLLIVDTHQVPLPPARPGRAGRRRARRCLKPQLRRSLTMWQLLG